MADKYIIVRLQSIIMSSFKHISKCKTLQKKKKKHLYVHENIKVDQCLRLVYAFTTSFRTFMFKRKLTLGQNFHVSVEDSFAVSRNDHLFEDRILKQNKEQRRETSQKYRRRNYPFLFFLKEF